MVYVLVMVGWPLDDAAGCQSWRLCLLERYTPRFLDQHNPKVRDTRYAPLCERPGELVLLVFESRYKEADVQKPVCKCAHILNHTINS